MPTREVNLHVETENIMRVCACLMHAHIDNPYDDDEETWCIAMWLLTAR